MADDDVDDLIATPLGLLTRQQYDDVAWLYSDGSDSATVGEVHARFAASGLDKALGLGPYATGAAAPQPGLPSWACDGQGHAPGECDDPWHTR